MATVKLSRTNAALGAVIRRRRTAANLTLTEVATKLGVTYQQVQKYETGANRLSVGALIAFADLLGCEVKEILTSDVLAAFREEGSQP